MRQGSYVGQCPSMVQGRKSTARGKASSEVYRRTGAVRRTVVVHRLDKASSEVYRRAGAVRRTMVIHRAEALLAFSAGA